jgi:hypothetical protein
MAVEQGFVHDGGIIESECIFGVIASSGEVAHASDGDCRAGGSE